MHTYIYILHASVPGDGGTYVYAAGDNTACKDKIEIHYYI